MAEDKYNLKNPSVKRILQEVKEMQSNPSDDFISLPIEENIFEWQFAIRGPGDSEFEGGIYHGRIQLPAEYPFKPPSFMLLTPNGRFETNTKICLSISNHHPEHWQPSWSVPLVVVYRLSGDADNLVVVDAVRTALVALIAFMPTNPNGALGSLDYPKEERRVLAVKSREAAPRCENTERQKLIDEIHEYMMSKAPPVPQASSPQPSEENLTDKQGHVEESSQSAAAEASREEMVTMPVTERAAEEPREAPLNANPVQTSPQVPDVGSSSQQLLHNPQQRVPYQGDDRLFTWAAVMLTLAIGVLLLKKFMKANGYGAVFMDES